MEEAVVGAIVGATIQVVLQNLLTLTQEQMSLVRDFKKDLEKLKNSFLMVEDFLCDAEMQQVTDRAVKRWLRNLEDVAFDADNVLDEINYQVLANKNKMKKKVHCFLSYSNNPIAQRCRLSRKIRDINKKLELINQEANGFGLHMRLAGPRAPAGYGSSDASARMETDSFTVDPIILGRENDVLRIVEMLTSSPAEQVFCVVPIVGMGGLGKTTLARLVFGDQHIITHFETRVWVHVPKHFDVVILLKNILTSLTAENVEHGNREALLKKLQNDLGPKRYLLVLDDVWNEEREKWDDFINSLLGITSAIGNGIVVTTRSKEVASIVKTLPIQELESLSEDNCWSIIKAKAFRARDIPSEFETMGKNIGKRCQGLPLAAKVVGGLLCGKSKDEWLSVEKNWLSNFGNGNTISKILKLSFDNLSPPSLKKCFAYCSIFPKGFHIIKEQLIELWMAEGFLQTDQTSDMETMGSKFFYILLQNSLLQVVERDGYDNVTYYNMHDLVHDLACSVLGENDNVIGDITRSRYIGYKSSEDESCSIKKEQERYLRTLFFNGKVSDIGFSHFKCLHTLTLVGEDIDELPTSIRELIHLRYLDTTETSIRYLPDSVGELYHLQTLRAENERLSYLVKLPNSFKYLISLRHLHIPYNTELPPEIGRLTSLQTLPYFKVGHGKGCGIAELGSLKNLKGKLEIHNLQMVHDKDEAKSAYLIRKTNIHKLKLVWDSSREDEANDHENVLEGLQPHPNLKSLGIHGFKGRSLPLWSLKMAVQDDLQGCWIGLDNLMDIRLENCSECEEIPMLGQLPHLKSLYLCSLSNVKSIGSSFYGNIDKCSKSSSSNNIEVCKKDTIVVFRALESLELCDMSNLIEWAEVELPPSEGETQLREVVVFPRLEYLKIETCRQLMSAPSHFPCLKELHIIWMDSVLPLANICGMKLTSLTYLRIRELNGLRCLPDELFSNNHNLVKLHISDCSNLMHLVPCFRGGGVSLRELWIRYCWNFRELPDDIHSLNSLEKMFIYGCPNLKSIPFNPSGGQSQGGFASLRELNICYCEGLTNLPVEMVEFCAPTLECLTLSELSKIMNLGMVIGCLQIMPSLTSLTISVVPKFTTSSIGSLRSLQDLKMGYWSDSRDYVSFKETVDAILQASHLSLRRLTLYGMEHWDFLPNQLQHLTALSDLLLNGFGIETLPEWFGNLSSLQSLSLRQCKKLRHLPSKEAMQRLTKLTYLNITLCPLLRERCNIEQEQNANDSEWPKISHIPDIVVDGHPI
ncbi:hypothetical protein DH2020_037723 [Rehmannia glutinosa]|uniref:Uncharacterized protein n=1 Tax=Rehmannia glutinosa TaxID=99300 RepID=A0ABR0V0S9_REHGL